MPYHYVYSTLQDRLVKKMRLRGISDIEAANTYLPAFIEKNHQRFGIEPANPWDTHRKNLPPNNILHLIFSYQTTRETPKNLELSYLVQPQKLIDRATPNSNGP